MVATRRPTDTHNKLITPFFCQEKKTVKTHYKVLIHKRTHFKALNLKFKIAKQKFK